MCRLESVTTLCFQGDTRVSGRHVCRPRLPLWGLKTGGQGRVRARKDSLQLAATIQFSKSVPLSPGERATSHITNHAGTLLGARQLVAGVDFGPAREGSHPCKPQVRPPAQMRNLVRELQEKEKSKAPRSQTERRAPAKSKAKAGAARRPQNPNARAWATRRGHRAWMVSW